MCGFEFVCCLLLFKLRDDLLMETDFACNRQLIDNALLPMLL
jgi:hypothetical protein